MAFEIITSRTFRKQLKALYEYLKKEWSVKVADDFLTKVEKTINGLSSLPTSGSICEKRKNTRRLAITKHNKVYYNIKGKKVYIKTLFDTRQNPKKNKYE